MAGRTAPAQVELRGATRLPWAQVSPWVASAASTDHRPPAWYLKYRRQLWLGDLASVSLAVAVTFGVLFPGDAYLAGAIYLPYGWLAPIIIVGWVAAIGAVEAWERQVIGNGREEYRRVLVASLYLFGALALLSYLLESHLSRALYLTTLPLGACLLLLERWVARGILHKLRKQGHALTRTLIVGTSEAAADVVSTLRRNRNAGYLPAALYLADRPGVLPDWAVGLEILSPAQFDRALATAGLGAVIVTEGLDRKQIRELAWKLENRPVQLMFVPRLVDVAGPRLRVREAEGLSLMHVDLPRFSGGKLVIKRGFDMVASAIALILLSPVFLAIAILIKLDDGGPVLFRQERVGRYGEPFTIHKFRTMCVDAEAKIDALLAENGGTALLFKLENDPRITRIGTFLRRYSLDELPQFWSVLRGGMSVVGPRPQVAREVAEYTDAHHRRLLIKPGITGLWQVNGRNDLSPQESIRLDLRYVENWSLVGDVTIILKTVGVVLRSDGAY